MTSAVTATNSAGHATANSYSSAVVAAAQPVNTAKPVLSGTARDGQALSTTAGTWTGTPPFTYTYQWLRCDPVSWVCTNVAGATNATYTLTSADVGYKMTSAVTATNSAGHATANSYSSAVVAAATSGSTLFVSPSGSDSGSCSQSAPCQSFDRAYQVASPGSTVVVTCPGSSCSYPDQTIASSSAKPLKYRCRWGAAFQDGTVAQDLSGCIHFQPDQGKTVTVSNVSINAPYVYLDGFTLAGARGNDGEVIVQNQPAGGPCLVPNSYTDIIVRNVNAYNFFIKGTAYLSFVDDVFDGQYALSNTVHECGQSPQPYDTNHVLFDGVTVKNVYWDAAGEHVEGIHWWDGDQVLITNSRFLNDAQFDINFDGDRGNLTHITVQNTIFDATCSHQNFAPSGGCNGNNGQHALSMNNRATDFQTAHNVFAYNSFPLDDWPSFSSAGNMNDIRVYGSVMEGPQNQYTCDSFTSIGVSFDHNIFDSNQINPTPCGTTNSTGNNPANLYTNPANYDFTQRTGSPAIDFIPSGVAYPSSDIVDEPRPQHAAPDAGSYEHP
jgi:hypothetical protein